MTSKKCILVASTPDGQYRAQQALGEIYDLRFASTLREAELLLTEGGSARFDMIICGIHFDDSQMFELLRFVRSVDHFDSLPFLVIQARHSALNVMTSVKSIADKLGACGFLELHLMTPAKANKALQTAVRDSFDKPVKYERYDRKQDL